MAVASLLAALGVVGVLFALVSFLLAAFGAPVDVLWLGGNLVLGVLLLVCAAILNFDALRERMSSGEAKRAGKYGTSALVQTLLLVGILGMVGFVGTRDDFRKRLDLSEAKVHSLSDQSRKVLANLERNVEIVGLFSKLDERPVRDLLERYEFESDRFQVVAFADPNARPDLIQRYEIPPEQIGRGVLRVAIGEESTLVDEPTEEKVTNAIVKLSRTGDKKVYFLEGHNERRIESEEGQGEEGYTRAADALRNENYRVEKLLLAAAGDVPADADAVVVAGPTRPLLRQEHQALQRYLERGGALLVMVDPRARTDLVDDLATWGVDVGDDIIVDRQLALFGRATTPFAGRYDEEHPITKDLRDTTLFHVARSVRPSGSADGDLTEIVFTGESSWAERDLQRFFDEGAAELSEAEDLKGPVPVAVAGTLHLSNGSAPDVSAPVGETGSDAPAEGPAAEDHAARLVVFGDADFASNELIEAYRNRDLFLNSVNWLLGDVEAISIRPARSRASRFEPTAEQFQTIRLLSLFVLPEGLAILGVFVWWSRRHPAAD